MIVSNARNAFTTIDSFLWAPIIFRLSIQMEAETNFTSRLIAPYHSQSPGR